MNFWKHSASFDAAHDIPSLNEKQCILEYARHGPAEIWLAARNLDKAKAAVEDVQAQLSSPANIKLLQLDLSSLDSGKKAARTFSSAADRLDILMLNAGIMTAPPGVTEDEYEVQFGTNYMGHALLANLLLPVLENTALKPDTDVRIISLTSYGHISAPEEGLIFDTLKTSGDSLGSYGRYGQSKLANILWTRHMARLYSQLTLAAIHPGAVRTNLLERATATPSDVKFLLNVAGKIPGAYASLEKGVKNQLWASVSKDVKSGEYYEPVGISGGGSDPSKDMELAEKL